MSLPTEAHQETPRSYPGCPESHQPALRGQDPWGNSPCQPPPAAPGSPGPLLPLLSTTPPPSCPSLMLRWLRTPLPTVDHGLQALPTHLASQGPFGWLEECFQSTICARSCTKHCGACRGLRPINPCPAELRPGPARTSWQALVQVVIDSTRI